VYTVALSRRVGGIECVSLILTKPLQDFKNVLKRKFRIT
jgi:hypothetical protein